MTYDVIDLFSGPDGWGTGFRQTGSPLSVLGIEIEPNARETAMANGHKTILQDIATLEPQHYGHTGELKGLIASPPCQGFSAAGKGKGREDSDRLIAGIAEIGEGYEPDDVIATLHKDMADDRSVLALEPLRWAISLRPEWTVWEQVPAVLPIWEVLETPNWRASSPVRGTSAGPGLAISSPCDRSNSSWALMSHPVNYGQSPCVQTKLTYPSY